MKNISLSITTLNSLGNLCQAECLGHNVSVFFVLPVDWRVKNNKYFSTITISRRKRLPLNSAVFIRIFKGYNIHC